MAFVTSTSVSFKSKSSLHHHRNPSICPRRFLPIASSGTEPPAVPPLTPTPPPSPQSPKSPKPEAPPRLSNVQVFLERLGDTLVDARIHYVRQFSLKKKLPLDKSTTGPRVVVLGTGWGAHSLVKVIDVSAVQSVTVISPRNFFFFTPLLSATAVGTVEFRSIVEPIRKANPFIDYFEASATDIDVDRRVVQCIRESPNDANTNENGNGIGDLKFEIPYDVLVIAVGETTATFNVPGAREYAYFLKEISDARRLRSNLLERLERASLPIWTKEQRRDILHFIVVGGGPTGCEFAGELSDFVEKDLAPRYGEDLVSNIRVTLLQSGKSLLNQFENSLQDLALQTFSGRVEVMLGARVSRITNTHVVLQNGDEIAYGLLVWAAGNATRPIVKQVLKLIGASDTSRKLSVDSWMRVSGAKGIFALGDCAQMDIEPLPATAQVAGQQGAFLGRLLSKVETEGLDGDGADVLKLKDSGGKILHPFQFLSLGIMAYLGNDQAVIQVEATKTKNLKIGGRIAYLLWRSVYAVKQVDVRNRVLVLFDYFKSRVYGRDISQF